MQRAVKRDFVANGFRMSVSSFQLSMGNAYAKTDLSRRRFLNRRPSDTTAARRSSPVFALTAPAAFALPELSCIMRFSVVIANM